MTTDYKPNSLAIKILCMFLADRKLIASADRLADLFGTTPKNIRQTIAPTIGRDILRKEFNDLTGEQDYAAGRHLDEMAHLLPEGPEQIQVEAVTQAGSDEPAIETEQAAAAPAALTDVDLVAITNTEVPASRIDIGELQLCDIPAPTSRAGAISRYDGHFREALESGRAITMPPDYVKAVADAARGWIRHHAPRHQVKSCGRLTGCHFGAVWIVKGSSRGGKA